MAEKALYLLAQFDEETEKSLAGYYQILQAQGFIGKQTKQIPYHFTLGSFDCVHESRIINELEAICGRTSAFDICLSHIGLFGLNVLFIEPNMNFELLSLQKEFFADCANGYHEWSAHVTMLMDEPDVILKALPVISEAFEPIHARIESVGLYEFFPARFIKVCKLQAR